MEIIRAERIQKYVNKVLKDCEGVEKLTNKEFLKKIKLAELEDEERKK